MILALGNTANVLTTVAKYSGGNVKVAYGITHPVLDITEDCFYDEALRHKFRYARIKRIRELSKEFDFIHAELDYAADCYRAGVPYGLHIHGIDFWKSLHRFPLDLLYRKTLDNASYVAVSTKNLLPIVRRFRQDAFLMPNPVDLEQFKPQRNPSKILFCPSRIEKSKGNEIVWKAAFKVARDLGYEINQVEWGESWKALGWVNLVPLIPHSKIADTYNSAFMTLGQMKLGSLGMAELEAAACMCPTLCYSNDLSPFLPNTSTLEAVLMRFIENEELTQRYAKSCFDYVVANHDARKITEQWERIWENPGDKPLETSSFGSAYSVYAELRYLMIRALN